MLIQKLYGYRSQPLSHQIQAIFVHLIFLVLATLFLFLLLAGLLFLTFRLSLTLRPELVWLLALPQGRQSDVPRSTNPLPLYRVEWH